ncbi:MAG TPA: endonuclease domain-containing protein [Rhizomicrobium sp.]|jgi:very-short-patch-repair endonuclease|nr:endonuclease domain-containing protein [Rhizomicrobium sp.]
MQWNAWNSRMAYVAAKTLSRARALRRKMTGAETLLWSQLRRGKSGMRFRRQHPIGPYIADFACVPARLVIEIDGATHSTEMEVRHDAQRDAFLRTRSWRVVRLTNDDVYRSLDAVLELIWQHSSGTS